MSNSIQRPIIFIHEIDVNESQPKKDLQNWKPRQRQTPIIEFSTSTIDNFTENNENFNAQKRLIDTIIHEKSKFPTNVSVMDSIETSSDSHSGNKTLTPDDLDAFKTSSLNDDDKFGVVFEQLNRGIKDLHDSLLWDSKHSIQPHSNGSFSSLSDSSKDPSHQRHLKQLKDPPIHGNSRNKAYLINTELHATFDVSNGKSGNVDFKVLARTFIDKTKDVYKLKIAIRNKELENADRLGDREMVKKLRMEESTLANEFIQWKRATKKHYKMLHSSQKDAQKLQTAITELQQKIQHAQKEAERLCINIDLQNKPKMQMIESVDKVVQTTERLVSRNNQSSNNQALNNQSFTFNMDNLLESSFIGKTRESLYFVEHNLMAKEESIGELDVESSTDHNSSIVSLIEDDSILRVPEPQSPLEEKQPSNRVPPLDFNQLNVSEQPMESMLPTEKETQLSGKAMSISNNDNKSTANTDRDVSSIAFDNPANAVESSNELVESSRLFDEHVLEQDLLNQSIKSSNTIEDQLIEEPLVEEQLHNLSIDESKESDKVLISNVEEHNQVEEMIVQANVIVSPNQVKEEKSKSDSVASELPSSALDNSLSDLDTPIQDTPQASSSTSSSVKSVPASNPPAKGSNESLSSLASPPTASDKSILRVKSFQISSEVQSSTTSEVSTNSSLLESPKISLKDE